MLGSVDSQLRARVTDSSLSRDLFPSDYDPPHSAAGGGTDGDSRPTRWMALESLVDRGASSASDMVRAVYCSTFILGQIRQQSVA